MIFALTLAVSYLVTQRLGYGLFLTIVLATTSVGLVVPTLRNTRRSATHWDRRYFCPRSLRTF